MKPGVPKDLWLGLLITLPFALWWARARKARQAAAAAAGEGEGDA